MRRSMDDGRETYGGGGGGRTKRVRDGRCVDAERPDASPNRWTPGRPRRPTDRNVFDVALPADMSEPQPGYESDRPTTPKREWSYDDAHDYYREWVDMIHQPSVDVQHRNEQSPQKQWHDHEQESQLWPSASIDWTRTMGEKDDVGDRNTWQGLYDRENSWNGQRYNQQQQQRQKDHKRKIHVLANFNSNNNDTESKAASTPMDSASQDVPALANKRVSPKLIKLIMKAKLH